MEIKVTKDAIEWFHHEFELSTNKYMRIFVRYGGCGSIQQGFSLGLIQESPKNEAVLANEEGLSFFIEEEDLWYFEGKDVTIDYDKHTDEIEFIHQ